MRAFFEKYKSAKLPAENIACHVLVGLGLPKERAKASYDLIVENGKYAGILREIPTGLFVDFDSRHVPAPAATHARSEGEAVAQTNGEEQEHANAAILELPKPAAKPAADPKANRVFITHGKHKGIVAQLKELLAFGQFEPVVSVEREATAIPVPEKVFEDMRSCAAGVIHVGPEGEYLDKDGNKHVKINDNVLIEIGAAIALYGKKVILLVEKGVTLPSNLQGLYRCEFEGDRLEYDATMKLLKTFSQFR
jgi:predicted nucleotide-binding protein